MVTLLKRIHILGIRAEMFIMKYIWHGIQNLIWSSQWGNVEVDGELQALRVM